MQRTLALSLAVAFLLLAFDAPLLARDIHVDSIRGRDGMTGQGTLALPYRTITRALEATTGTGHTIVVAPGVHDIFLGERFPLVMRPGISIVGSGFEQTRIVGDHGTGPFMPTEDVLLDTSKQSVYRFTSVLIPAGVTVRAVGSERLVLIVSGSVLIQGTLDVSGEDGADGVTDAGSPVPGGAAGAGGFFGQDAPNAWVYAPGAVQRGGGQGGAGATNGPGGGGGAGHSRPGVSGRPINVASGFGGVQYGVPQLTPPFGGSGGGAGGTGINPSGTDSLGGGGGGGGGILLLLAHGSVVVEGQILCDGGNGGAGASSEGFVGAGGAGGGSGGSVRVRGSSIRLQGGFATVLARGGSGGLAGAGLGFSSPGSAAAPGRLLFQAPAGAIDLSGGIAEPPPVLQETIVAASADVVLFPWSESFSQSTRLQGLSIEHGDAGIRVTAGDGVRSRPSVRGVAVSDCVTGVQVESEAGGEAAPFLSSAYLHDNTVGVRVTGAGVSTPVASHVTVVGHETGFLVDPTAPGTLASSLRNSIFFENGDDLSGVTQAEVAFCDIGDGDFAGVNGNVSVDPLFLDQPGRDLHIQPSSPLVDVGTRDLVQPHGHDPDLEPRDVDLTGGGRMPDIGADEAADPTQEARYGDVNATAGFITDVVFLDGSVGDISRRLTLSARTPVRLDVAAPPAGPAPAPFVLYAAVLPENDLVLAPLPLRLGTLVFEIPLVGSAPAVVTLINNIPHPRAQQLLGTPLLATGPAPVSLTFPRGVRSGVEFALQGIMADVGAENGRAAVTNALVVTVE